MAGLLVSRRPAERESPPPDGVLLVLRLMGALVRMMISQHQQSSASPASYYARCLTLPPPATAAACLKAILAEADGIIISRGNLGLDVEPEKMALVQKTLIQVGRG